MNSISGISTVASNFSMNRVPTSVSMALLAKTLDNAEKEGADMLKLLELSANPDLGANFDAIA